MAVEVHWCLCLLDLPSLRHLLLLLYHHLLLLLLLLVLLLSLAIRIRHRVYRDVSMWVKSNTDAVRRGSTILPGPWSTGLTLPPRGGPGGAGETLREGGWMTEGWTARTTIGTDASVSFSAGRASK
jgi:hypothetical protein